jgi:hypothetical protein
MTFEFIDDNTIETEMSAMKAALAQSASLCLKGSRQRVYNTQLFYQGKHQLCVYCVTLSRVAAEIECGHEIKGELANVRAAWFQRKFNDVTDRGLSLIRLWLFSM